MPDIEQRDLLGARSREHPPAAKGQQVSHHAAAFVAGFCAGTSGYELAPRRAGEGRVFEKLGLPLRLLPRRIYYGVASNQKRYFALKLPLAVDPEIVTFAYIDPGHQTDRELHSWGAAHGPLWDALRKKGRQVRVIGIAVENATVDRAARVLEKWAATEPGTTDEQTPMQELKAISEAMVQGDSDFLAPYGGHAQAMKRAHELFHIWPPEPEANEAKAGVSIDDFSTWRAVRFADRDETG